MPTFANIQEEIESMLSLSDEELDDGQRAAMDAYLDELGSQEEGKVDAFGFMVKKQSSLADFYKAEAERIAKKAKTIERRLDYMKGRYLEIMLANGLKKIAGKTYTLSVRDSKSVLAPSGDEALKAMAGEYPDLVNHKESWAPIKTAIKAALERGEEIPGCSLVVNKSLQLR